jgi:hypothetical protein
LELLRILGKLEGWHWNCIEERLKAGKKHADESRAGGQIEGRCRMFQRGTGARIEEAIAIVNKRLLDIETCAHWSWTGGRMLDSVDRSGTIVFEESRLWAGARSKI